MLGDQQSPGRTGGGGLGTLRGWDLRTPGRGGVDFEEIVRGLNRIGYDGPLSVEWEKSGMDPRQGATEVAGFVRKLDFQPSQQAFDAAFKQK